MIRSNAKPGSPQVVLENSDIELIKQCVADGLGTPVIAQKLGISKTCFHKCLE
jgi:hypothetical protein